MEEKTVVGIFKDTSSAEKALTDLQEAGISDADISYAYSTENKVVVEEGGNKAGEGAAEGAGTGAIIGGLAGLAVANGILPGLGTLFVAGPLAAALGLTGAAATTAAGALSGAAAGGLVGALVGLGMTNTEASIYEKRIKSGEVLVAAKTANPTLVKGIFEKYGVEEINEFD